MTAPTAYQVSVSGSTAASVAFASANKASLTVNRNASISTVTPSSGLTGQALSVAVTGLFTNFVQGATRLDFGTGITVGTVTVTNSTSLTVAITVAGNATSAPRNVTATTGIQVATKVGGFSVVLPPPPTISDFNPKSGPIGTTVNLTGTNLAPPGVAPQVVLNQQGSGTLFAPLVSFSATALSFTIPAGAAPGPVMVQAGSQNATSSASLTVTPSGGFTVSANPPSLDVIRGQSAAEYPGYARAVNHHWT